MEKMKNYQKPAMRVVKLQQRYHLLEPTIQDPKEDNMSRELRGVWKDGEE